MAAASSRILVVEDEADVAQLIKHTLERGGDTRVETVASGPAALAAVAASPPDLVILDLNLPGLDGREVCRMLRARPASATIPIIMLTARVDEQDRVLGLDLGADDYMTKPFSPRELAARIRAVLRRRTGATGSVSLYRGPHLVADFDAVSSSCSAASSRTAIASCRATACSSASGATTSPSKPARSTSTSAGCAPSSARPARKSKPSSASGIDSWDKGHRVSFFPWGYTWKKDTRCPCTVLVQSPR
jgi:DNA-binding response OmpR family regulator